MLHSVCPQHTSVAALSLLSTALVQQSVHYREVPLYTGQPAGPKGVLYREVTLYTGPSGVLYREVPLYAGQLAGSQWCPL